MKTFSEKSSSKDTLTRNHQGTSHKQIPVKKNVSTLSGSIPLIQLKSICPCDGGCPRCIGTIQPKLTIGQPNDKYEQEADRVADKVMRMPEPGYPEYFEEENERIQAKQIQAQTLAVPVNIETGISALKGGGQPLPESVRAFFEPRFGRDFSQLRVHTDTNAANLAYMLNARAFTANNNIFFGAGEYNSQSSESRRLLAHELAHVEQQSHGLPFPLVQRRLRFIGTTPRINRVLAILNTGLFGHIASVNGSGFVVLTPVTTTGSASTMQSAVFTHLHPIITNTSFNVTMEVQEGTTTLGGDFDFGSLDIADIEMFGSGPGLSALAILVHEIVEQYQKQVRGIRGPEAAHRLALPAEYDVVGATRGTETVISGPTWHTDGSHDAEFEVPYTYPNGRIVVLRVRVVRNNIVSVSRRTVMP